MKSFLLLFIIAVALVTMGCCDLLYEMNQPMLVCDEPATMIDGRCCYDVNDNGICDNDEEGLQ